ncbi:PAS domain S-box protein [Thermoleptolyngbya sichuanensis A183]|uniref:histidine kinase n=1 Tax=Thermoleptolyngbya sichuanensis A183 TaxID=2737172 RepID=A0A6M8B7Z6_9CYAN|nr:PAS domain-containing protein [Thermoleptolyngbya sichuanensis]QKD82252.1 PAS domain S-box protein [Thermoleptolyngbya sichuanensis A183]
MGTSVSLSEQAPDPLLSEVIALQQQVEQLRQQLLQTQQEKADLEVLLNMVTGHSDQILSEVEQEKTDLEILLETATEHSMLVETDLQQQVEEERRQREEQFQSITAATPVGLLIAEVETGRILYANERLGDLLGLSPAALLAQSTVDFYAQPEERVSVLEAIAQNQTYRGELLFRRADGSVFWGLLSMRPFGFNRQHTLLTAIQDISDRKQAEDALRIAEAKYRGIFENAVEGIFRMALDGDYLEVNRAMAGLFGYTSPGEMLESVRGATAQLYVDPAQQQDLRQRLESQDEIKDFEYAARRQDGSRFWASAWARAIRSESGDLLYYEGSCIDITQRKQQEEALKREIRKLRIEVDQTKRQKEVAQIEQTDYFQWLVSQADDLRLFKDAPRRDEG